MIRVVGLDLSLTISGVAKFSEEDEIPRLAAIESPRVQDWPPASFEQELERIRLMGAEVVRWALLGVEPEDDVLFVIEGPSLHSTHGKPDERAGLRWIVALNLRRHGRLVTLPPASVKGYWTGNGNAKKQSMLAWAEQRYPNLYIRDHNLADALALAHAGASHRGILPTPRPPLVHPAYLIAVRWPE